MSQIFSTHLIFCDCFWYLENIIIYDNIMRYQNPNSIFEMQNFTSKIKVKHFHTLQNRNSFAFVKTHSICFVFILFRTYLHGKFLGYRPKGCCRCGGKPHCFVEISSSFHQNRHVLGVEQDEYLFNQIFQWILFVQLALNESLGSFRNDKDDEDPNSLHI